MPARENKEVIRRFTEEVDDASDLDAFATPIGYVSASRSLCAKPLGVYGRGDTCSRKTRPSCYPRYGPLPGAIGLGKITHLGDVLATL